MLTRTRGCLGLGAVLLLFGACGGDQMGSSSAPTSGTTPSATASAAAGAPSSTSTIAGGSMVAAGTGKTPATTSTTPASTATVGAAGAKPAPPVTGAAGAQMPAQAAAGAGATTSPAAGAAGAAGTPGAPGSASAGSGATAPAVMDGTPNLFWLEFNGSRVMRSKDMKTGTMVAMTGVAPDGVAVDAAAGKVYWTNMGSPLGTGGGTVQRSNLDGSMTETIVPAGVGTTFKQTTLDLKNKKIYWGDREGKTLFRANLDGSMPEKFVTGHNIVEVVGVAVDTEGGKVYFTDRSGGRILRAGIEMPAGATGDSRMDVEDVLKTPPGATPIDLEIDHTKKKLYWTDRMLGTVHVMDLEMPAGMTAMNRTDDKTIVTGLSETIGIALDVPNNKMYFTELGGTISVAALDGSGVQKGIIRSNGATGCALVYLPN